MVQEEERLTRTSGCRSDALSFSVSSVAEGIATYVCVPRLGPVSLMVVRETFLLTLLLTPWLLSPRMNSASKEPRGHFFLA